MTEHEDNRVHYLVEACEVRGHLDIKSDDLSLILRHQRELGKEDALAYLAAHDKEVRRKFVEWCRMRGYKGYSCYEWQALLERYEKEQKEEQT